MKSLDMKRRTYKAAQENHKDRYSPSAMETRKIPIIGRRYGILGVDILMQAGLMWVQRWKFFILLAGIIAVVNSTLGSTIPSGAINYIGTYFNVTSDQQLVLPISLFLVGYVLGPLFFGPLSETYGRRIIMVSSFVIFTIFVLACAVAPNWPVFLVFRLICGIMASSAIAVIGGLYADVFGDPVIRGRAMAIFMTVSQQIAFKTV